MPDFSACTPLAAHRTYYCPAQPGPLSAPTRPALGTNPIAFGFPSGSQLTPRWRKPDSNHRSRGRPRRRDIGSRRADFSVAASRADTSPSLETLVVSRRTDGSIRLVPAEVRRTLRAPESVEEPAATDPHPVPPNGSYEKLTSAKACCHFLCRYPCMLGDRHELPAG